MAAIEVRRLESLGEPEITGLADVLNDCVHGGASVSFMLPMSLDKAARYWHTTAGAVARGKSLVLSAFAGASIVGTVTLLLRQPENQPHRADIAKMLVHRRARRGWQRVGEIPDYALWPGGGLCPTTLFYKRL